MLDGIAAPAGEVARTAVSPAWKPNTLGDRDQINRRPILAAERLVFVGGMSGTGRELLVRSGGVVTDEAVDVAGIRMVERFVRPSVTGVTTRAARLIGPYVDAVVVEDLVLAVGLPGCGTFLLPRPVDRLHEVLADTGVARQTGCRDFWCGFERSCQRSERGMVHPVTFLRRNRDAQSQQHAECEYQCACSSDGLGCLHLTLPVIGISWSSPDL